MRLFPLAGMLMFLLVASALVPRLVVMTVLRRVMF